MGGSPGQDRRFPGVVAHPGPTASSCSSWVAIQVNLTLANGIAGWSYSHEEGRRLNVQFRPTWGLGKGATDNSGLERGNSVFAGSGWAPSRDWDFGQNALISGGKVVVLGCGSDGRVSRWGCPKIPSGEQFGIDWRTETRTRKNSQQRRILEQSRNTKERDFTRSEPYCGICLQG